MLIDFNTTFESALYNKEVKHQIQILKKISEYSDGVAMDILKDYVKLNERTIHKYIISINELIDINQGTSDNNHNNYGYIIRKNNKYIYTGDHFQFQQLYKKLIEGTVSLNLILKLITHKVIKVKDFIHENFISETSLRRSIYIFNDYISKYDVSISIERGLISFIGNEINIRYLIDVFMWRNYNGTTWPFDNIPKEKMNNLANTIITLYGINMSSGKRKELMFLLATNFSRIDTDNIINMNDISSNLIDVAILNNDDQNIYNYLFNKYNMCNSEILFILLWIKSISDFYFIENKPNDILNILKAKNHIIYNKINNYIIGIENITKTKIMLNTVDSKTFIATLLAGKYHAALFKKLNFTIANIDSSKLNIKKHPNLIKIITNLTAQINNDLSQDEMGTLIYFNISAFLILFPEYYFDPTINILIQMDAPIFEEAAFSKKIRDNLVPYFNVSVSYINYKEKKYDLIISTIINGEKEYDTDSRITISNNLTDNDLDRVISALTKISEKYSEI